MMSPLDGEVAVNHSSRRLTALAGAIVNLTANTQSNSRVAKRMPPLAESQTRQPSEPSGADRVLNQPFLPTTYAERDTKIRKNVRQGEKE